MRSIEKCVHDDCLNWNEHFNNKCRALEDARQPCNFYKINNLKVIKAKKNEVKKHE